MDVTVNLNSIASTSPPVVEMAPMQGVGDAVFRQVFQDHFSGIERCYTPFVMLQRPEIIRCGSECEDLPIRPSGPKMDTIRGIV